MEPTREELLASLSELQSRLDLLEARNLEHQRLDTELLLRDQAIASSSCGITIADARLPDMPLIYVNRAFEKITGYSIEETEGKNCRFLQGNDRDQEARHELRAAIDAGEPCTVILRNFKKDGTPFWNELNISPVQNAAGELTHFIGVQTDVTRRKDAEDALRESNKELENFAYVVSHDLKAPLRGIGSVTSWLISDHGERLDDEGRELLNLLKGRVARLGKLIDGILQYSRAGRKQQDVEPEDLNPLLQGVIDMLDPPETMTVTIQPDFPVVPCDATRMRQVWQNLVGNAIKYMGREDGTIELGWAEHSPRYWRFHVRDNGQGIDPKYHEKIFQVFQTLTPRDQTESTGIGLSIVKKSVEQAGGNLTIESNIGEGATFTFTWPRPQVQSGEDSHEI